MGNKKELINQIEFLRIPFIIIILVLISRIASMILFNCWQQAKKNPFSHQTTSKKK